MSVESRPKKRIYKQTQWEEKRPLITTLYKTERRSLTDVCHRLATQNFYINERQLRTRIDQWGIARKNNMREMRTAAQLLERLVRARQIDLATNAPRFRIRGEIVRYREVLRYFQRKHIRDPIRYVQEHANDGFTAAEDVEMLTPDSSVESLAQNDQPGQPAATAEWVDIGQAASSNDSSGADSGIESSETAYVDLHQQMAHIRINSDQALALNVNPTVKGQQRLMDQIIQGMRDYCDTYLASSRARGHLEPSVHNKTPHGTFGERMQDGMALVRQSKDVGLEQGFEKINLAFDMVTGLLQDDHPMTFALMMTVLCELMRHNTTAGIGRKLIEFSRDAAVMNRNTSQPLRIVFEVLSKSQADVINLVLLVMKCAIAELDSNAGALDWKTMYVKERFCDCLYYSMPISQSSQTIFDSTDPINLEHCINERKSVRVALLRDQELFYGLTKRNVLYTITNVADDLSELGYYKEARAEFRKVLIRADTLKGYHQAKTRFAALEGLGIAYEREAENIYIPVSYTYPDFYMQAQVKLDRLQKAIDDFRQAEEIGTEWFDGKDQNRRTKRVTQKIEDLTLLISAWKMAIAEPVDDSMQM